MNKQCAAILKKALKAETQIGGPPVADLFHKALKADPSAWEVYYHRGHHFFDIEKFQEAVIDFSAAISLMDGIEASDTALTAELYTFRGICFRYLYFVWPALADFNKALAIENPVYTALLHRGYLHYLLGHDESAEQDFTAVRNGLGSDNDDLRNVREQAVVYLACLYHVQGKTTDAEALLEPYSFDY